MENNIKPYNFLFVISLSLILMSCTFLVNTKLDAMGIYNENVKAEILEKGNQVIVFIPMKHIAPPKFYGNVTCMVDSLNTKEYYFFEEGITSDNITSKADSLKLDTIVRKFRKITGRELSFNSNYGGTVDTVNNTMRAGNKVILLKRKIVTQPLYSKMHISPEKSRFVDITAEHFVKAFEDKYTKVELENCDYNASLYSKYDCNPVDWKFRKHLDQIILNLRNENVANEILKNEYRKTAVIYGAAHIKGIAEILKQNGYTEVKK